MAIAAFVALVLVIVGWLTWLSGHVWGLVLAFQDSALWGFAYLFVPFAALVFVLKRWSRTGARKSFWLQASGTGVIIIGSLFMLLLEAGIPFGSSFGSSNASQMAQQPTETGRRQSVQVPVRNSKPIPVPRSQTVVSCYMSEAETTAPDSSVEVSSQHYSTSSGEVFSRRYSIRSSESSPKFDFEECMRLGNEALIQQNYERAEAYYKRASLSAPFGDRTAFDAMSRAGNLAFRQQVDQQRAKMRASSPGARPARYNYQDSMRVGYAAFQQKDYQTALINFERAIEARPGDRLALDAINNTRRILQQQSASTRNVN
ncbi:tetratricopeptide repeat protein [Leptolyngbya sp. AN02str]|uniref:tetratricopeptide repeat protein n=1 Tax=Leptolyngbya sp. AN02str TaxID=3423363 RepID=UPI003D31EA17